MSVALAKIPAPDPTNGAFRVSLRPSVGFTAWLQETGGSLAFSTYQAGRVFLVSAERGQLYAQHRRVGPAMGLAANADRIWVASRDQLWRFANTGPRRIGDDAHDVVYAPRFGVVTGPCDTHEIASDVVHDGRAHEVLFANTRFSCVAAIDRHYNFMPVWKPSFISGLAPEDRCHLNGLAVRDGKLAFVTACGETDIGFGWREAKAGGGVLIDVEGGETVARGLSMPHSPRWHDGRVWLSNSGTAEFGFVDLSSGRFEPVAQCAGFARGTAMVGGRWAVVGLSKSREGSASLPMGEKLAASGVRSRCGLMVVDLQTGEIEHEITLEGDVEELFDVAFIEQARRPYQTGFSEPELQRDLFNQPSLDAFPLSQLTGSVRNSSNVSNIGQKK